MKAKRVYKPKFVPVTIKLTIESVYQL